MTSRTNYKNEARFCGLFYWTSRKSLSQKEDRGEKQ